ncbi:hypothetical protein, partial [Pseudomonas helleri]|uniref:hypothetical protein n=1 Tax=Pseudomonas helleri TaxID=1608996 RepID=UPI001E2ADB4C
MRGGPVARIAASFLVSGYNQLDVSALFHIVAIKTKPTIINQYQNWAVAGAECNTVIELKPEHHAASPWH